VLVETPEGTTSMHDYIVKSEGFRITNSKFHGITDSISQTQGVPFPDVARLLLGHLEGVSKLVMHNADFCISVLKSEMFRIGMPVDVFPESVCTMQLGTDLVKLPGICGYKYPTFGELYYYLFGKLPVTTGVTDLYEVVKKMRELRVL
jgi:DNA polymerase III epsilon subunit-like protein